MKILFFSCSLFTFAYFAHLIIWKTTLPKNPMKKLLVIFFVNLLAGVAGIVIFSGNNHFFNLSLNLNLFESLHAIIMYLCLSLTYCLLYQGISDCSPTCIILLRLNKAKDNGLKIDDFYHMFNDDKILKPRIRYLAKNNLTYIEKDKYRLSPRGNFYVNLVKFQRRLFGFDQISG
tara:strand:- start:2916 stop:3440 length:525 start_codon:yes stop_codon:yes gene_type:complete